VPAHWWGPFAVWDGGMGIWGGIALGSLVGIWRLRRAGVSPAPFMDAAAPALLVGQAIGRIGNYFTQGPPAESGAGRAVAQGQRSGSPEAAAGPALSSACDVPTTKKVGNMDRHYY
jgi:hypothetical protein